MPTLNRTHQGIVNPLEYGATLTSATLTTTLGAIGSSRAYLMLAAVDRAGTPGAWSLTSNVTIPSNVTLLVAAGATLSIATGVTITCNASVEAGLWQWISLTGTGKIVFANAPNAAPEWWGAVGDGTTDDTTAIAAMHAATSRIVYPPKTYRMNSAVTVTGNNIDVDFDRATFVNGGANWLFTFGAASDTPLYTGLRLRGGTWTQANPATTSNYNYIRIVAYKEFVVRDMRMGNVSNGGLTLWAGTHDGVIDNITVRGGTANDTLRGIWLDGSSASDYTGQLVDISSITRNATALPVYAIKNVIIQNCTVIGPIYAVYLTNTRHVQVKNNYLDISGAGFRCVALNDYSPYAQVTGNTMIGDQSSTGILVTQYSHDVLIKDNTFLGTFGGGRDIYCQYLAQVFIEDNLFSTNSTQQIQVNMGAAVQIRHNTFLRPGGYSVNHRAVYLSNLDPASAGTSTFGNTATSLASLIFSDNTLSIRLVGVYAIALQAANGNYPGIDVITVKNNIFHGYNLRTGSDEFPLRLNVPGSTYKFGYEILGNSIYPSSQGLANVASWVNGTGAIEYRSDANFAVFSVNVAVSGGAITTTRLYGDAFTLTVTRSSTGLVLSGRSSEGTTGGAIGYPVGIVDTLQTMYSYDLVQTINSNWFFQARDSAGAVIDTIGTAAAFIVLLVATND